ncbi:replication-relaxation family protein [Nocardia amikacinitolerans]|uniref:replication-relaxation family protein n=1 Tax=Nocardia amikacinitolerans TaxID=756689 RepID=UPI0020A3ABE9|nr:replication-relaxation family protein [Nocardia amikacinitolerans]MCP2290802.1 Replication-relaxation [Nocardia amikacinitolerans]
MISISKPERQANTREPRPNRPREPRPIVGGLTGRDRWILRMVHEHRVLTTDHLAALAFPTAKLARRRLAVLYSYGVLDRFRPWRSKGSRPYHWTLAPAGASVLAGEAGIKVRELGYSHQTALSVAHSLHLKHALGVADWFTTLTTRPGGGQVSRWWSQTRCQRLWGDLARPDAFGRYTRGEDVLDFYLEYDLGSTALSRVAAKLHGFAELARTTGVITPVLLWVPTTEREANARAALRRTWERLPDPVAVPVATAAADLLAPATTASPAERVWLPLHTDTGRQHLHGLTDVWPMRTPPNSELDTEPTWAPLAGLVALAPPPPLPPAIEDW